MFGWYPHDVRTPMTSVIKMGVGTEIGLGMKNEGLVEAGGLLYSTKVVLA